MAAFTFVDKLTSLLPHNI